MRFYVLKNQQQQGPYTAAEVSARLASGEFAWTDLAWHEGLPAWTPIPLLDLEGGIPVDLQSIPSTTAIRFAGFGKRFAAMLLDYLIFFTACVMIGVILGILFALLSNTEPEPDAIEKIADITGVFAFWLYNSLMESSPLQGSIGKLVLGIKVTDSHGNRVSFSKATGRHFGKILSALTLGFGYLMASFTQRKQALHDIMADCLVIRK
jgi:uncharacterized RDD family membrane protein YckC